VVIQVLPDSELLLAQIQCDDRVGTSRHNSTTAIGSAAFGSHGSFDSIFIAV
jgi:hypothetical protein